MKIEEFMWNHDNFQSIQFWVFKINMSSQYNILNQELETQYQNEAKIKYNRAINMLVFTVRICSNVTQNEVWCVIFETGFDHCRIISNPFLKL